MKSPHVAGFAPRFQSRVGAGGVSGGHGRGKMMNGRGERARRASVPPRPRQGDRAVTTTWSHGGAPLAAPHQLAKGEEGRAPAPLGLSGFYSYASLKAVWGLFSHPLVPARALQLSSWLQRTPSCTGTGSAPAASAPLAGATRKGTRPAQQAAAPARCLGHTCDQTRLLRAGSAP